MRPLVSVIIATYNRSNILPFSIGSVLDQTLSNFELLVVGDGCTDNSEAVVKGINDSRVQWLNLPANSGHQSYANNEGLKRAQGTYIAYLGHDDLWLPHHLEVLITALEQGADVCHGLTLSVDFTLFSRRIVPWQREYSPGMWIPPTGTVHRKNVTDEVGNWRHYRESNLAPEAELWLRAFKASYKISGVQRLTAIKFPAASRKDVYKTQPCDEQAIWLERIRREENFERTELTSALIVAAQIAENSFARKPYGVLVRELARETRCRLKQRMRAKPQKGAAIDAIRRFKGLDSKL